MSIEDVAHHLYGLAPEEFTRARNARAKEAKAAGDLQLATEVQRLRKPTTGAWLLNQLVREHGDEVQQVLELGAQLRAAQGTLGADELRALDRQRRQLTHAVAQQARALGRQDGRRVTEQVTGEVEETLRSAMVDAAAGAALSAGLLTDTFSSTGLEPVDLSRVVALPGPATSPETTRSTTVDPAGEEAQDPRRERERADARQAVEEAESALRTVREVLARAREEATQAQHRRETIEAERDEARRRLEELDARAAAAAGAHDDATRVRDKAVRDEAAAVAAVEQLRERVERLAP